MFPKLRVFRGDRAHAHAFWMVGQVRGGGGEKEPGAAFRQGSRLLLGLRAFRLDDGHFYRRLFGGFVHEPLRIVDQGGNGGTDAGVDKHGEPS